MKLGPRPGRDGWSDAPDTARADDRAPGTSGAVALILIALLLVAGFVFLAPKLPGLIAQGATAIGSAIGAPQGNYTQSLGAYSPLIQNGTASVTYPSDYPELSRYALGLINADRSDFNLGPVVLSPNEAGQQHADSMLEYGYFSHFDTQGYKPYMRYTLLGGEGGVFENVASASYSFLHFTSPGDAMAAIKVLESSMMYNDSVCCGNGHRDNILNPLHDRVSIGIAYNGTALFFDEDFENYYVNMSVTTSGSVVTMQGAVLGPGVSPSEAFIGYDQTPAAETPAQLNSGPREYDPGTIAGGVLPPCSFSCSVFTQGITVHASVWEFTRSAMKVSFSLSEFVQRYGPGVYTVYLVEGSSTDSAISSYSVFVS
jgi:uncharacterized protein YkwD